MGMLMYMQKLVIYLIMYDVLTEMSRTKRETFATATSVEASCEADDVEGMTSVAQVSGELFSSLTKDPMPQLPTNYPNTPSHSKNPLSVPQGRWTFARGRNLLTPPRV